MARQRNRDPSQDHPHPPQPEPPPPPPDSNQGSSHDHPHLAVQIAEQILNDLGSSEHSRRVRAMGECGELAPHVGAVLTALLRGLNDDDEGIRLQAIKGLMRTFPDAEDTLARFGDAILSNEPKARLQAIRSIIIVLSNVLASWLGMKLDDSSTTGNKPDPFREIIVKNAGRWIAMTRDRERVLAIADSFDVVMEQALAAGESDPYVKKVPGLAPEAGRRQSELREDESPNILDDIQKLIPDPDTWLNAPNDFLGGKRPCDLINSEGERELRYLLRGIVDGITT